MSIRDFINAPRSPATPAELAEADPAPAASNGPITPDTLTLDDYLAIAEAVHFFKTAGMTRH